MLIVGKAILSQTKNIDTMSKIPEIEPLWNQLIAHEESIDRLEKAASSVLHVATHVMECVCGNHEHNAIRRRLADARARR